MSLYDEIIALLPHSWDYGTHQLAPPGAQQQRAFYAV